MLSQPNRTTVAENPPEGIAKTIRKNAKTVEYWGLRMKELYKPGKGAAVSDRKKTSVDGSSETWLK